MQMGSNHMKNTKKTKKIAETGKNGKKTKQINTNALIFSFDGWIGRAISPGLFLNASNWGTKLAVHHKWAD